MTNRKTVDVKTGENINLDELDELITALKKLDKFEFNLNTYVEINF